MPTTITKTIGVGKDYASINAWVSGAASTYPSGLVAADVIWRGVLYQEGSGTNNEWVISSPTTAYALTCDSTRYYLLEAASGQSFADNPNKLTNALQYNNANGVSISVSGSFVWLFDVGSAARLIAKNLQIKTSVPVNTSSGSVLLDKCLVSCSSTTIGRFKFSAQNSVLQITNASGNVINTASVQNQYLVNCTVIGAGAAYAFVFGSYSSGNILRNCTFFGFSTGIANTVAPISAANSTYNITDLASFGWSATGNLVSKVAANQFVSVTSGSEDFRVKAGADVIKAGIRAQTYTNDVDIVGSARSTSAPSDGPTIGAWEYPLITYTYARPASDITTQWSTSSGSTHYTLIDETVADDNDYIVATAAGQTDEVKLQSMTPPQVGTNLVINYKVTGVDGGATVTVSLRQGSAGTLIKTDTAKSANGTYALTVTPADWAAVTDWSDLRLRFVSA